MNTLFRCGRLRRLVGIALLTAMQSLAIALLWSETAYSRVLENPRPGSFQSGISTISGWVCSANFVQILIDGINRLTAAYGTSREDTRSVCGDADNGFGLLFNWNILGEGLHTAALCVDGLCGESIPFFVNTYGTEFLRGIPPVSFAACTNTAPVPFPTVTVLAWQESQQNWAIALTPTCAEIRALCVPPVAPELQQACTLLSQCCQ